MAIEATRGGLSNARGGNYALNLRPGTSARKDRESNDIFAANLSLAVKGMGKYVLGAFAAEALMEAINSTKHDSSRAGANWNLSIGHKDMNADLSPHDYNQFGSSWGEIGTKGSKGTYKPYVLAVKAMYWGISHPDGSAIYHAEKGGRLHDALGLGRGGTAPNVTLFNPILGDANPWREGYHHEGNTYAYNAFGGSGGDPDAGGGSYTKGLDKVKQKIGDGYIPWMINYLQRHIQQETAAHRIIKT